MADEPDMRDRATPSSCGRSYQTEELRQIDIPAGDEQTYSDYKKFHADVKITVPTENQ